MKWFYFISLYQILSQAVRNDKIAIKRVMDVVDMIYFDNSGHDQTYPEALRPIVATGIWGNPS